MTERNPPSAQVFKLADQAQRVVDIGLCDDPDAERRRRHAARLVNLHNARLCPALRPTDPERQVHTRDAPELDNVLQKLHRPATAAVTDDTGRSDVLIEAAAILKAFKAKDDAGKGRMLMDAIALLVLEKRAWAFWQGSGADDRPELLIRDLNLTNRLARWFRLYECWIKIGVHGEGFYFQLRGELDDGNTIDLHLDYFETLGEALAAGMTIFCYAKRVKLTAAWIRDL